VSGSERSQAAQLLLARAQRETGALAAAEATAKALLADKDAAVVAGARVELARPLRRLQGRGAEARARPGGRRGKTAHRPISGAAPPRTCRCCMSAAPSRRPAGSRWRTIDESRTPGA
jgi:hypothetical protein